MKGPQPSDRELALLLSRRLAWFLGLNAYLPLRTRLSLSPTQIRSHFFFKQKQLDFNPDSFAFAPQKPDGGGKAGGEEGTHHSWPSSHWGWPHLAKCTVAIAGLQPPAPGACAPQPLGGALIDRPGRERRTRYSLYLGSCPYMAMCTSASRAAAPYKDTRQAPG